MGLRRGRDRCAARRLVDQGHLAERLTGAELTDLAAAHADRDVPRLDHDERLTGLALLGDRFSLAVRPLEKLCRKPLEELVVRRGEERDAAKKIEAWRGHRRILSACRLRCQVVAQLTQ